MNKLKKMLQYSLDRLAESSTWQGLAFVAALFGAKFGAGIDWGQAAALGGLVSGFIKALLPDNFLPKEK